MQPASQPASDPPSTPADVETLPPSDEYASSSVAALREIAVDELWKFRELIYQFAMRDIRIRYKQAVMGFAWAILMPALVVAAGALVRFAMAYLGGGEVQIAEIAGMAVKALGWSFFVGAIGFGVNSLTGNLPLITKIYFPREALPVATTLAQTFDSVVGTAALVVALPLMGVTYSLTVVWALPLAVLLFVFTLGTGLFLGCANLFFRDVKYIVQVLLTFGIFFTPVFFEPEMFGPTGAAAMMLNPLSPILEGLRLAVVEGHNLALPLVEADAQGRELLTWSPWYMVYSTVCAGVALVGGALLFHKYEFVFAEYA